MRRLGYGEISLEVGDHGVGVEVTAVTPGRGPEDKLWRIAGLWRTSREESLG